MDQRNFSYPNEVFKRQYTDTFSAFIECLKVNFEPVKRDHQKFHNFISDPKINDICKNERLAYLKLIDDGMLDYGTLNDKSSNSKNRYILWIKNQILKF